MNATRIRVTGIGGANIVVVTVRGSATDALPPAADIICGASIAVVTGYIVGDILAASLRFTTIIGARVVIVAVKLARRLALPVHAEVTDGANIPVKAICIVVFVHAADFRIAAIVSAEITVVAIRLPGTHAFTACAYILDSTGIIIVAGPRRRVVVASRIG